MSAKNKRSRMAQRPRKGVSGIDPTQMKVPTAQGTVGQAESREQRMLRLLSFRRMAREMEGKPLYFLPVETNPLAVMGVLQTSDPEKGPDLKNAIPWSILDSLLPLPQMDVENRVGMYYKVAVADRDDDSTTLKISRHDIIKVPEPELDPEQEPSMEPGEVSDPEAHKAALEDGTLAEVPEPADTEESE